MSSLINLQNGVSQFKLTRPADPPGQLQIHATVVDSKTIIDFGQVVQWIALEPDQLEKLIGDLQYCLRTARTLHLQEGTDEDE